MKTLVARALALFRRVFFWLPSSSPSDEFQPDSGHDHTLILSVTTPRLVPTWRQIRYGIQVILSATERRVVMMSLLALLISGGTALGIFVNSRTIRVPTAGGSLTEALIGSPKYLTPLDAPANDVDLDIVSLVYSGLFRMQGTDVVPDLAESYTWSPDGKTLTVTLRTDARFHNGDAVTADDVQFTIDAIQDPVRNSRLSAEFRGVKAIATDAHTIQFTLEQPSVAFLQALTVGVLPSRLWENIPAADARLADLNLKPVGSGPYRLKSFTRDSRGYIRTFTLERWDGYYGTKPFLTTLTFQFYPDRKQAEDALKADLVQALAFTTMDEGEKTSSRWHHVMLNLPQETIAFFNVKQKTLSDERVRRAFAGVIDRHEIIDTLHGNATAVTDPFPYLNTSNTEMTLDEGRALLEAAGWVLPKDGSVRIFVPKTTPSASTSSSKKKTTTPASPVVVTPPVATASSTELAITILTSKQPQLEAAAEILKRRWSLLGARVTIESLETDELLRRATRDRNGQVILTNVLLNPTQDIFPFWWSGQVIDRGLNLSNLADRDVDTALDAIRTSTTTEALRRAQEQAAALIKKSTPAAFLVRPSSTYLVTSKVRGVSGTLIISRPADRFLDLMHWYTNTGWRWK